MNRKMLIVPQIPMWPTFFASQECEAIDYKTLVNTTRCGEWKHWTLRCNLPCTLNSMQLDREATEMLVFCLKNFILKRIDCRVNTIYQWSSRVLYMLSINWIDWRDDIYFVFFKNRKFIETKLRQKFNLSSYEILLKGRSF